MTPSGAALKTTYLLFACESGLNWPFEVLVALTGPEIKELLDRMALADRLYMRRHGPHQLVYEGSLTVQYERVRPRAGAIPVWAGGSRTFAVPAHASVAAHFLPPVPRDTNVRLHVDGGLVFLTGQHRGTPFQSTDATWSEIMRCRLATAQPRMLPKLFRELATVDPWTAGDVLESGLRLYGSDEVVREIRQFLSPSDLMPMLEFPEVPVRERAIAALGRLWRAVEI